MDEESFDFCIETNEEIQKPESYQNGRIVYSKERNICVCPMDEILYPSNYRKSRRIARYYNAKACVKCPQKCTNERYARDKISMKKFEFCKEYDDKNIKLKQIYYVPDKQLLKQRKSLSEHPLGMVKRCLGADYFLLKRFAYRGNCGNRIGLFSVQYEMGYFVGTKQLIEAINMN